MKTEKVEMSVSSRNGHRGMTLHRWQCLGSSTVWQPIKSNKYYI